MVKLRVATAHVGWVIVPATGALGVAGCASITTLELATDSQPAAFVSVKVYVAPAANVTTPLPSTVGPLGVKVKVLVASKLAIVKLPVATAQVGWVIVPATGALGVAG